MFRKLAIAAASPLLFCFVLNAADPDPIYRVGNGVSAPRVLHKVNPDYSPEARADRIQGAVVYALVVDKSGKPRDIELLSPLGYGLDEKGLDAIRKWTFTPAQKDGMPVSVKATIEVNFNFVGLPFDSKQEERRTSFNVSIHQLQTPPREKSLAALQKLAAEKYPPAMGLIGSLMIQGSELPKDVPGGIELVTKSADKHDGIGLYVLGMLLIDGKLVPTDADKGLRMVREASTHGSADAQWYLGKKYEAGDQGTPVNAERARTYFRLCAARGSTRCQLELGKMLIPKDGASGDAIQAVAWLELAQQGGSKDAESIVTPLRENLSAGDQQIAEKLKAQLVRH